MTTATGTGTGTGQVLASVRGHMLLHIEWLRRRLGAIAEDSEPAEGVGRLADSLLIAGEAALPLLIDPRAAAWCAEVGALLDRGAATILPAGHFLAACRRAAALALSARFLFARENPDAAMPPLPVRAAHAGKIRLLGTRIVLDCGARSAGLEIAVGIRQGHPVLPGLPDARVTLEPAPLPGVVVPDGDRVDIALCGDDPILRTSSPVVAVLRGTRPLRSPAQPGIAVVPATASAQWRGASVAASAAHLRSAFTGQDLRTDQDDLPPPGIAEVADYGQVTRLLELFSRGEGCAGPQAEVAGVLGELASWLNRPGRLSEHGELTRDRLAACGFRGASHGCAGHGGTGVSAHDRTALPSWRARWQSAGGRWRPDGPRETVVPAVPELGDLLARLGAPRGVEINTLAGERARADQTMDHLSLMSAREPGFFAVIAGQLNSLPACPARSLLAGHVAYIGEQFSLAASTYAELLAGLPHDIDLWRDFAFALRHLGQVELNELALFRLPEVVERACECRLALGPLEVLRAEPERWRSAPAPARLLAGLLEWMRIDSDHR